MARLWYGINAPPVLDRFGEPEFVVKLGAARCDLVCCGIARLAIGLGRVSRWQTLSFDTASPYKRPTCQGLTSLLGMCREGPKPRSNACVRRPICSVLQ